MKKYLFVSRNKHTTNIITFDEDFLVEAMNSVVNKRDGLSETTQQEILSQAFTSHEIQNDNFESFIESFKKKFSDSKVIQFDENRSSDYTFRLSDRTDVSIRPTLIPLDKINPEKPAEAAAIIYQPYSNKQYYVGKHLIEGGYKHSKDEVRNKDNCIGIVCNGSFIRKGLKMPMNNKFEEEDGLSM